MLKELMCVVVGGGVIFTMKVQKVETPMPAAMSFER